MVTIGMNYEVIPGKEAAFEAVFDKVLGVMRALPGHQETTLYKAVPNPRMYLIVSKWRDKASFDAFIASEQFRKVTDWGKSQILAGRPTHEVYGAEEPPTAAAACPVSRTGK